MHFIKGGSTPYLDKWCDLFYNECMDNVFETAAENMVRKVNYYRDYTDLTVEKLARILENILTNVIENFGEDGNNIDGFAFGEEIAWWENSFPTFWDAVLTED